VFRSLLASLVFAAGVVLSVPALGDNASSLAPNEIPSASPVIGAATGTEETEIESEEPLEAPNASEIPAQGEAFSPTAFPIVATNPATLITSVSAKLNGSLNPNGLPTTFRFQYGRTTNYGSHTTSQTRTGNTARPVSANIGGLTAHTTYHFRLVATNATGTRYGNDRTFTTTTASTCNIAGHWAGTVNGTWYSPYCSWTGTAFVSAIITQNGATISAVVDYDGIPCFNGYTCGILDFANTTGYLTGSIANCPLVNVTYHGTVISGACSGQTITAPATLMLNGNTLSGTSPGGFTVILTRQP
jgi:hypothetical protein